MMRCAVRFVLFRAKSFVQQVHASGNNFGQAGGEAFSAALESNTHLAELVLGSKDEPASIPLKELGDNAIDSLDYSGKKLLAEGGIVLAFALKSNTSVTKVSEQHATLFLPSSCFCAPRSHRVLVCCVCVLNEVVSCPDVFFSCQLCGFP